MSIIKINVSELNKELKAARGLQIIAAQTANPNVPGNTAVLAAFAAEQTELEAALAAQAAARTAALEATAAADAVVGRWLEKLNLLAYFTETATGGIATKIISAGFEVRASRTPAVALDAVEGVIVKLNGAPGHSKLSWKALRGASGYVVQGSPDPITATSWTQSFLEEDRLQRQWRRGWAAVLVSRRGLQFRGTGSLECGGSPAGDVTNRAAKVCLLSATSWAGGAAHEAIAGGPGFRRNGGKHDFRRNSERNGRG